MYNFTRDTATTILEALKKKGYIIESGLNDVEVRTVEEAFQALLPPDLKTLLQTGIIKGESSAKRSKISSSAYYPDWRDPETTAVLAKNWIEQHVFRPDIEKNNYWYRAFGEEPKDKEEAVQQALSVIRTWPPLFPIHGHRFMPSIPHESGNPILSIWQATDTVYYGMNLLEHMNMEFRLGLDVVKGVKKAVPFWGDAFDLEQIWQPLHPSENKD